MSELRVSNMAVVKVIGPHAATKVTAGNNQRLLRATSWNLLELKSVPFVRCFS